MICGFQRGDIQVYEVKNKWDRICNISKCHNSKVVRVEFFKFEEGKIKTYEALSVDERGNNINVILRCHV